MTTVNTLNKKSPIGDDKHFYRTFRTLTEQLNKSFVNSTPLVSVGGRAFTINETVAAATLAKIHMYFLGSRGSGKTLLSETIKLSIFNDEGLYLRGDVNMQLKDLFIKLNLDGRTEQEVYQIADKIKYRFSLIDELNRVPGIIQNQFLNMVDGYIEIRGVKYKLGIDDYLLVVATGNPPTNGDYTGVFDEDLALLDRIPLIINFDEVPLGNGDVHDIINSGVNKNTITLGNRVDDILIAYGYLTNKMKEDKEMRITRALLTEIVYDIFRYVQVGNDRIDKAVAPTWREIIGGQHSAGLTMSYCSDISVRTLQSAGRFATALFELATTEAEAMKKAGITQEDVGSMDFVKAFLDAVKLALNYDRRFIPTDLPAQFNMTHAEFINRAFDDAFSVIASNNMQTFETMALLLLEFDEAYEKNDKAKMDNLVKMAAKTKDLRYAYNIMKKNIDEIEQKEIMKKIESYL